MIGKEREKYEALDALFCSFICLIFKMLLNNHILIHTYDVWIPLCSLLVHSLSLSLSLSRFFPPIQ